MIFRLETRLAPLAALVVALACVTACKDKSTTTPAHDELTVAAASDLTPAFEEIGRAFESSNKTKVVFMFGSTGMLTRQIENGAPVDLFAAANVSYIDELDKKGLIITDSKATYARGRITLWTPDTSDIRLQGIADLARPEVMRIAIANPDHAPYGLAAKQALESAGIWERVKPKLVYGDNIRQTLQYAETGNVDVAIAALPFEFMLNALRLKDGFTLAQFGERTGLAITAIQRGLEEAERKGLIERDLARVWPTTRGYDFLSDLQAIFLPDT